MLAPKYRMYYTVCAYLPTVPEFPGQSWKLLLSSEHSK